MKITNIEVNNFGGITNKVIVPKRVNFLIGPNGSGKTSFLRALKFGLIGTEKNTIKDGEKEASVSIDLNGVNLMKSVTEKGTTAYINGKKTTQKNVVEFLQDDCGASKDAMKFASSSEVFENAKGSDFTEFLLNSGFVPLKIDVNKFLSIAEEEVPMSEEVKNEFLKLLPSAPTNFELCDIENINKQYTVELKAAKKVLEHVQYSAQKIENFESVPRKVKDIDEELQKIYKAESDYKAYESSLKQKENMLKKIKNNEEILAANPLPKVNKEGKKALEDHLKVIEKIIEDSIKSITGFEQNNAMLSKQLSRLVGHKCPLSDKLVCNQNKEPLKAEIQKTIDNNNANLKRLQENLGKARENKKKTEELIKKIDKDIEKTNKLNSIKVETETLKKNIPVVKTAAFVDYTSQKADLTKEKEIAEEYQQCLKDVNKLEDIKKKIDFLSDIVEITSKNGKVKRKILTILASTLIDGLNDLACELCPEFSFMVDFNSKGNINIKCQTATGLQDYGNLSTGERLIVQFLIMTEINQLSGFKILVLDNLDKLDDMKFTQVVDFLNGPKVKEYYDHIFIASVNHKDFKEVLNKYKGNPDINIVEFEL